MTEWLRHRGQKVIGVIPRRSNETKQKFEDSPMCDGRSEAWCSHHPGMTCRLPAPDRRHHDLVAPAGAAIDFLAGAELQVLAHADAHLAQPLPVECDGDHR